MWFLQIKLPVVFRKNEFKLNSRFRQKARNFLHQQGLNELNHRAFHKLNFWSTHPRISPPEGPSPRDPKHAGIRVRSPTQQGRLVHQRNQIGQIHRLFHCERCVILIQQKGSRQVFQPCYRVLLSCQVRHVARRPDLHHGQGELEERGQ